MKIIAMYLPQFHQIKENDEWWGEGFTEWTTVQNAEKYYLEHNQPHVPLNKNYYNLLDKQTMVWQSELMRKYKVDGVCIYHYWFKDGRQILEKPAENLLKWTDIDMPFCFCWANETWARSWSHVQNKNEWANVYEKERCGDGILLEQKYGREQQWEEHFRYLLPFFKDSRYIKVDNKPLFLIYKAKDIPCLVEMLKYWNELARMEGLEGIYIVGSECSASIKQGMDAKLHYQPARSIKNIPLSWKHTINGINVLEYDDVWKYILDEKVYEKTFFEGLVGYDDTPRRGKYGCIVDHSSPEKFQYYLTELLAKSAAYENEIVFLNAWNEWGEGMYLEPDEEYNGRYLSVIPYAKQQYIHRIKKYQELKLAEKKSDSEIKSGLHKDFDKNLQYLHLMDIWMGLKEKKIFISDWLLQEGYTNIAVYGYGILGKHLCNELNKSNIKIVCIIDQMKDKIDADYEIYKISDDIPETDIIIVSAVWHYDEIYKKLLDKGINKVISLETILCEL